MKDTSNRHKDNIGVQPELEMSEHLGFGSNSHRAELLSIKDKLDFDGDGKLTINDSLAFLNGFQGFASQKNNLNQDPIKPQTPTPNKEGTQGKEHQEPEVSTEEGEQSTPIEAQIPTPNTERSVQANEPSANSENTGPEICSVYTRSTQVMYDDEAVDVYFNARDAEWDSLNWDYNYSGSTQGKGAETDTTWIKLSFNIPELGMIAGDSFTVTATVKDPSGKSDTKSLSIDVIGEEIKTWEVLFDNEDAQSAQLVDLVGDRRRQEEEERRRREEEERRRRRRSDPLVFDLDKDGILDTATGSHLADGNIDGETVLFDIDPSRASWAFVSHTDMPGEDAPALPNGRAVYEDGTRDLIGGNGNWRPQQENGGFKHNKAKLYDNKGTWVAEWVQEESGGYSLYWGSRQDKERTEWLKKGTNDGFLVWDHNGNGLIDDNTEMMSEFDKEGNEVFANGYEKLRHFFDKDGDGIIQGSELQGLMFWVDSDANAQTDAGELKTLAEYGITHIQIPETGELTSNATIGKKPTKGS